MTFQELEKAASQNQTMPRGLDAFEQATFLSLRCLYSHYRYGEISKESATEEKRSIKLAHEERVRVDTARSNLSRYCADLWKGVERATSAYRKERTLENADKVMEEIYGVKMPGGESS